MANNYETVTFLHNIPKEAIKPVHKLLLESMGFELEPSRDDSNIYLYSTEGTQEADLGGVSLDHDDLDEETRNHPLFVRADEEGGVEWAEVIQDILTGIDETVLPHIDVQASYVCDKARQGEHGGWCARVTRDGVRHGSTDQWFREWDAENSVLTDMETLVGALGSSTDPAVLAAVARISDYVANHPSSI